MRTFHLLSEKCYGLGLKPKPVLSFTDFAILGKPCNSLSFLNHRMGINISILLDPPVDHALPKVPCSPGTWPLGP